MAHNKLYRKLVAAKNYLEEIKAVDFSNQSCVIAVESYKAFTQYLIDHFKEIEESSHSTLYINFCTRIIPSIRYVERASTSNIPWSVIPYLDRMLKELFGSEYLLLFRPQWHFNYSVIAADLISSLKQKLDDVFPTHTDEIARLFRNRRIYVFSFPYLEKTNVLLLSTIGHELGHFYHEKWKETQRAKELLAEQKAHLSAFYRGMHQSDLFLPYEKATEGIRILEGMYREILADICGYLIFGPSMLFALDYISIFEAKVELPSQSNNYYPPTMYRIRVLYERILANDNRINLLSSQSSECGRYYQLALKRIDNYLADKKDKLSLGAISEEISLFESALPELITFALGEVRSSYLHPRQIEGLYAKLDRCIPANELEDNPVEMADIILAGWIQYSKINETSTGDNFSVSFQVLMRLLLKSIFSSHVHAEYKKAKGSKHEHLIES